MFFVFNQNNPKQLIYYIILILFAILFEYLELVSAAKTIGIGLLAAIIVFVLKTLIGCSCDKKE